MRGSKGNLLLEPVASSAIQFPRLHPFSFYAALLLGPFSLQNLHFATNNKAAFPEKKALVWRRGQKGYSASASEMSCSHAVSSFGAERPVDFIVLCRG